VNEVSVDRPLVLTYGDHVTLGRVCLELGRVGEPRTPSGDRPIPAASEPDELC
jgi:hypothetical protein